MSAARAAAALAIAILTPASAQAAVVTQRNDQRYVYTAAAGETNALEVREDATKLVIHDAGAPITAIPARCDRVDAATVRCLRLGLDVALADGDDTAVVLRRFTSVDGGPGADTLAQNAQGGTLAGGDGDDVIVAEGESVLMRGDAGADRLSGTAFGQSFEGGAGDDVIVGAGPTQTVSYVDHKAAVTVDLAAGSAVAAGEHDQLQDVENIVGGAGNDVLRGDAGPNAITPGPGGRDTIDGRGGNDALESGSGGTLTGGAGDDHLELTSRRASASCGAGRDTASVVLGADAADCERAELDDETITLDVARPLRATTSVRVACSEPDRTCRGRLRVAGVTDAVAVAVRDGHTRHVSLQATPAGRRVLRGAGHPTARLYFGRFWCRIDLRGGGR